MALTLRASAHACHIGSEASFFHAPIGKLDPGFNRRNGAAREHPFGILGRHAGILQPFANGAALPAIKRHQGQNGVQRGIPRVTIRSGFHHGFCLSFSMGFGGLNRASSSTNPRRDKSVMRIG